MPKPIGFVALFFIILCTSARAQSAWEFGATVGGGPSLVMETLGGVPDRQLYVTTVFARHRLVHWKGFEASYVGAVLPAAVVTGVGRGPLTWFMGIEGIHLPREQLPFIRGLDWGAGIAPVGLQLSAPLVGGASVFVEAAGGGVAFGRAMPDGLARSLNFLGSAGAGIQLGRRGHRAVILGYRLTHLSNANTAGENPGFNAHVFFVGMTLH